MYLNLNQADCYPFSLTFFLSIKPDNFNYELKDIKKQINKNDKEFIAFFRHYGKDFLPGLRLQMKQQHCQQLTVCGKKGENCTKASRCMLC